MANVDLALLEEKQSLLAAIVNFSEDAIISKTLDGIITSWNPAAETLFGYTAREAIGRHISLIIPANRLHEEDYIISKISNGKRIRHFETIRVAKSGKNIAISLTISPVKNNKGQVIGASKIARDIGAEKKEAEKKSILASIVNYSDDAIISKTLDGIITSWNKSAERLFGYTEAEAIGQPISVIIPDEQLEEEAFIIAQISRGLNITPFETVRKAKNDQLIPVLVMVSPILDEKGRVVGASKIAHDISDTVAARQERETLYEQVKELNEKKDEFIAMTSHELKTPITSLSGYLQLIKKMMPPDDKNYKLIDRCYKQVEKLSFFINDLLEFTRVQSGKFSLQLETFNMLSLITEYFESHQDSGCHQFRLIAEKDEILVHADPLRIEQVIANLLGNAIKYSPDGGMVEVTVSEQADFVTVSVKDEGIGIDAAAVEQLFSQFYRAVNASYKIPGLGMGLFIAKQILERHNGSISVRSEIGKGSVFEFRLPKYPLPESNHPNSTNDEN